MSAKKEAKKSTFTRVFKLTTAFAAILAVPMWYVTIEVQKMKVTTPEDGLCEALSKYDHCLQSRCELKYQDETENDRQLQWPTTDKYLWISSHGVDKVMSPPVIQIYITEDLPPLVEPDNSESFRTFKFLFNLSNEYEFTKLENKRLSSDDVFLRNNGSAEFEILNSIYDSNYRHFWQLSMTDNSFNVRVHADPSAEFFKQSASMFTVFNSTLVEDTYPARTRVFGKQRCVLYETL